MAAHMPGRWQGNRDNIDSMASGSQKVLNQVLKLIDTYDLYGSVAYPKQHQQSDISDIYRLPLRTRGVFTNVALQEPFGLTVIEVCRNLQITTAHVMSRQGLMRLLTSVSMSAWDGNKQLLC